MQNRYQILIGCFLAALMNGCASNFAIGNTVWTVDLLGRAWADEMTFPSGRTIAGKGTERPVLDRRGSFVAFSVDGNIWVRDLKTHKNRQLTSSARAETATETEVFNLVAGWSPSGGHLLVYLDSGNEECEDCPGRKRVRPPRQYGFHLIDLTTAHASPITLSGDFVAWRTEELVAISKRDPHNSTISIVNANIRTGLETAVLTIKQEFLGANYSSARDRLLLEVYDTTTQPMVGSLLELDFESGLVRTLRGPFRFGTISSASYSPTGLFISYVQRSSQSGDVSRVVKVDDYEFLRCAETPEVKWASHTQLAIGCGKRTSVFWLTDNRPSGRYVSE